MTSELCRVKTSDEKDLAVLQVVSDTLALSDRDKFLKACGELLESKKKNLVIDMRGLRRVFSIFLGTVLDVNARAGKEGRQLQVMASEDVAKLFRTVAGPDTLEIHEIDSRRGKKSSRRRSGRTAR